MTSYPVLQIVKGDFKSIPILKILGTYMPTMNVGDPALLAHYISNFKAKPDDVLSYRILNQVSASFVGFILT